MSWLKKLSYCNTKVGKDMTDGQEKIQGKASIGRGVEGSTDSGADQFFRLSGASISFAEAWGNFARGTAGKDWQTALTSLGILFRSQHQLIGGILAQLIVEVKDRLGKSEECIVWYQKEVEEYSAHLARLEALMEQFQIDVEDQDEEQADQEETEV
jgi:hypothetical protein